MNVFESSFIMTVLAVSVKLWSMANEKKIDYIFSSYECLLNYHDVRTVSILKKRSCWEKCAHSQQVYRIAWTLFCTNQIDLFRRQVISIARTTGSGSDTRLALFRWILSARQSFYSLWPSCRTGRLHSRWGFRGHWSQGTQHWTGRQPLYKKVVSLSWNWKSWL